MATENFGDEVMGSALYPPFELPISVVTLLAFEDLGYQVELGEADLYGMQRGGLLAKPVAHPLYGKSLCPMPH